MSLNSSQLHPGAILGNGGDSASVMFQDNGFASVSFMIICTALVMMMTPFVGLLYSGLSTTRNGLSSFLITMMVYSVVTLQWFMFGYSLAFSEDASGGFIGDLRYGGLKNILNQALPLTAPNIPAILFALYQMQFCTITGAILFGSVVERIRFVQSGFFIFIWATIVYCPIAYWTWGARGWLRNISCLHTLSSGSTPCMIGVYDFAGGGPVEICSGASALALTLIVGKRKRIGKAHNLVNVNIATGMLWFGWFGFNAGSALSASPRAAMAAMTTNLAAAAGSLSWVALDYYRSKKVTSLGYCSGALSGLVAITPACGFVQPWASVVIGILAGLFSNHLCLAKSYIGYDDTMDAFGVHGGSGFLGLILTGVFADSAVAAMDGSYIPGGAVNGYGTQVGYQIVAALSCLAWSFTVTFLLAWCFSKVPALSLRSTESTEESGLDHGELGERSYRYSLSDSLHEGDRPILEGKVHAEVVHLE